MAHVLIVDDEQELRAVLREALEAEGYTVTEASNGAEALTILRRTSERLVVLLDQLMPDLTGTSVLRTLQAERPIVQQHAFVLLTARARLSVPTLDLTTGLEVTVVKKPFELDHLLQLVAQRASRLEGPA